MENKIDFRVDYSHLEIFDEFNTKDIKYPIVMSVPHSGTVFPDEFLENVERNIDDLRSNEDCFVDELVRKASDAGIPMISMNIARAFVDVNRDKIEIDPTMFFNHPDKENTAGSRRCRVGLGVIHRITANNKNIYDAPISIEEVNERIENVYDPYHKRLQQLIDKVTRKFGYCLVLDCHSMPSKICSLMQDTDQIEFCLGTLFDQSCPKEVYEFFKETIDKKGYNAVYNCPYSGAYITFNYCQPRKKIFTLQLEVNRALYMDEDLYKKNDYFQQISGDLCSSIRRLANFLLDFKI